MTLVYIVDGKASEVAAALNSIANRNHLPVTFVALANPEIMFDQLRQRTPDLILLHHHWPGTTITQLLERIAEGFATTRVIVFTGQPVDVSDLIECVRSGVADYWTERGKLDPDTVFRRIDHHCSSSEWTMAALRRPSGSLQQLLVQAKRCEDSNAQLARERDAAVSRWNGAKTRERQEIRKVVLRVIELAAVVLIFTLMLFAADRYTNTGLWGAIAIVAIYLVYLLFLKGRLSEVLLRYGGGSAVLKSNTAVPDQTSRHVGPQSADRPSEGQGTQKLP